MRSLKCTEGFSIGLEPCTDRFNRTNHFYEPLFDPIKNVPLFAYPRCIHAYSHDEESCVEQGTLFYVQPALHCIVVSGMASRCALLRISEKETAHSTSLSAAAIQCFSVCTSLHINNRPILGHYPFRCSPLTSTPPSTTTCEPSSSTQATIQARITPRQA